MSKYQHYIKITFDVPINSNNLNINENDIKNYINNNIDINYFADYIYSDNYEVKLVDSYSLDEEGEIVSRYVW